MENNKRAIVKKIIITSREIYKPVGPYSQAVLADETLYVSGVLGFDTQSKLVSGGAGAEARQVLDNLKNVLVAAGSSMEAVIKTTILLQNIEDYQEINKIYGEYFTENYPARAAYQVAKLPMNAAVEIEAIALVGDVVIEELTPCPSSKT